jgi:hypothetical protein
VFSASQVSLFIEKLLLNDQGTQLLKDFKKCKFEFQNVNLNFKLTVATFEVYFGNSRTVKIAVLLVVVVCCVVAMGSVDWRLCKAVRGCVLLTLRSYGVYTKDCYMLENSG